MVLLGLVKFPDLNDRQIAEKIGLKLSTFTAIKNRLKNNDFFQSVRYPVMNKLGSELMFVCLANLNPSGRENRTSKVLVDYIKGWSDVFYAVAEAERMVALGYSRNYTEFRRKADEMLQVLMSAGLVDRTSGLKWVLFPLGMSILLNNFNHTRIIEDHFGVEYKPRQVGDHYDSLKTLKVEGGPSDEGMAGFTSTEIKVLFGLIRFPELPDNKIALEVGTTRQAVARIKKKLKKKGMIRSIRVPNLKKLGFEIITFTHMVFNPNTDFLQRMDTLNRIVESSPIPVIFHISKDDETVFLSAHRNYEEFNFLRSMVYQVYKQNDFLKDEPTVVLFSNADLETVKSFEFGEMVKNALEE